MTIHCIVGQRMHARCSLCGALDRDGTGRDGTGQDGTGRDGTGRDDTDRHIRKREDTHAGRDAAIDPGSIAISGAVAGEKRSSQGNRPTSSLRPRVCRCTGSVAFSCGPDGVWPISLF